MLPQRQKLFIVCIAAAHGTRARVAFCFRAHPPLGFMSSSCGKTKAFQPCFDFHPAFPANWVCNHLTFHSYHCHGHLATYDPATHPGWPNVSPWPGALPSLQAGDARIPHRDVVAPHGNSCSNPSTKPCTPPIFLPTNWVSPTQLSICTIATGQQTRFHQDGPQNC